MFPKLLLDATSLLYVSEDVFSVLLLNRERPVPDPDVNVNVNVNVNVGRQNCSKHSIVKFHLSLWDETKITTS